MMRGLFAGATLGAVLLMAACESDDGTTTSGGVVVIVETDMAVPKDLDRVDVLVTRGGQTIFQRQSELGSGNGKTSLPTFFSVFADRANGAPITIQAVGRQAGRARIVRDAITPVPASGLSAVHIPLGWLCDNTAVESTPGQVRSTCPEGLTCIEGACSPREVAPQDLAPFDPKSPPSPDKCFDAQTCFANGVEAALEIGDCSIATPQGATKNNLNLALKQVGASGICSGGSCIAALHADGSGGWNPTGADLGARIKLPSTVCAAKAQGKNFVILASTACTTKAAAQSQCPTRPPATAPSDVGAACTGPGEEACGNCGTHARTCANGVWSDWGACVNNGECVPGTSEACGANGTHSCGGMCTYGACEGQRCVGPTAQPCGNCGTQTRKCSNGDWGPWGECKDQGQCAPNTTELCSGGRRSCGGSCNWSTCEAYTCNGPATQACGNCGTQRRTCDSGSGQWSAWGACTEPTDSCSPTATRTCGNQGLQFCGGSCQYLACQQQHCNGVSGDVADGAYDSEPCGFCGTRRRLCTNGQLGEWSDCGSQGVCAVSSVQACGSNGTQTCTGTCAWGNCLNQTCAGVTQTIPDGATETGNCGNCGTQSRTCNNGTFTAFSACGQEGECAATTSGTCGNQGSRTCSAACAWGGCTGQHCLTPDTNVDLASGATETGTCECGSRTRTCTNGTLSSWTTCPVCVIDYDHRYWLGTSVFTDNGDGTASDSVAQLMWQRGQSPTLVNIPDATTYCSGLTLGGHTNWRVPTFVELFTLIDITDTSSPMVNETMFPFTNSQYSYWSATGAGSFPNAPTVLYNQYMSFALSTNWYARQVEDSLIVRCVRDIGTRNLARSYDTSVAGEVKDNRTGLIWQRGHSSSLLYTQAAAACPAGFRLPTIQEIHTVSTPFSFNRGWPGEFDDAGNQVWSSSTPGIFQNDKYSFGVYTETHSLNNNFSVRCVK